MNNMEQHKVNGKISTYENYFHNFRPSFLYPIDLLIIVSLSCLGNKCLLPYLNVSLFICSQLMSLFLLLPAAATFPHRNNPQLFPKPSNKHRRMFKLNTSCIPGNYRQEYDKSTNRYFCGGPSIVENSWQQLCAALYWRRGK